MIIKKIEDPSLAQEMSDLNHAAFGYRTLRDLSRYEIQQRMKDPRYKIYGFFSTDIPKLLGFLFVDDSPDEFTSDSKEKCIEHFSVWPWLQGKGFGSHLLNFVVNIAHHKSSFYLTVNKSNKAVHLYKKFGFVEVEAPNIIKSDSYTAMRLGREHGGCENNREFSQEDSEALAKAC